MDALAKTLVVVKFCLLDALTAEVDVCLLGDAGRFLSQVWWRRPYLYQQPWSRCRGNVNRQDVNLVGSTMRSAQHCPATLSHSFSEIRE